MTDDPIFYYEVKILKIERTQWYWRVLHYLTFKKYFDKIYYLKVIDTQL